MDLHFCKLMKLIITLNSEKAVLEVMEEYIESNVINEGGNLASSVYLAWVETQKLYIED
ncbi:hypothetical protein [Risungbinella massiliensis]|uniref:hypothetical protein n=1 Tax=Risungbinella massiliensis TaxID=1329796 RepID=UPI0012B54D36|nr:hypothetical protein [Risungbinella massiliensis]